MDLTNPHIAKQTSQESVGPESTSLGFCDCGLWTIMTIYTHRDTYVTVQISLSYCKSIMFTLHLPSWHPGRSVAEHPKKPYEGSR